MFIKYWLPTCKHMPTDQQLIKYQTSTNQFVDAGMTAAQLLTMQSSVSGAQPLIAPGTTAQYYRGDKTWQDLAPLVRGTDLTGLSLATATAITSADSVLVGLGKIQGQINAAQSGNSSQVMLGNGQFGNANSMARGAISLTTTGTSGAASYNSGTGVFNIPNYAPGTGTVTSVGVSSSTLTVSGSPVTSSGAIVVDLGNTGTPSSYSGVTTDAQGRVTAGTTRSFATPSRSIVTSASATGFQPSATRDVQVNYEGTFSTTSSIGGPASVTVFLETANTNSTTPGDWTTIARQVNSNTLTLAVILQQVDVEPWSISRIIPAGKFVRIRSGSITGTASAALNAEQQEVAL